MFLFLATTSLFLSCKNDDDSPVKVDASLVAGEWSLSETKPEDRKITKRGRILSYKTNNSASFSCIIFALMLGQYH
ncbi:hypothetical protein [Aquimarina muelleri]|uniref:Lipocalin-like domain-containing protein n=1 Tax=Aquimarina muelleri TaxID=279356 RepID=A0A918N1R8_9FLAO|nr:hypothetical protein [Aquimarina muelleri]MCX2762623.1 hypothetical protein [Aquimarina muelleri]GGX05997.1 hypothetical protein GCM10007384_04630 [Aquimarina muelleri]